MLKKSQRRVALATVDVFLKSCNTKIVQVYGPYPPHKGRSRWRIQLYCSESKRKISLTFASRQEATAMIPVLEEKLREQIPIRLHEAMNKYLEYKAADGLKSQSVAATRDRLFRFLPKDMPLASMTPAMARELYAQYTKSIGRYGVITAATHQGTLRNTKEMWRWFVKEELARSNPFEAVDPIGKANAGKPQLNETGAKKLDRLLTERAQAGDEGALALLVQVYLGLRSSEVLGLLISHVEREGRKVTISKGKTRNARRSLDLYPDVAVLLWKHCQGRPETERVFAASLPKIPSPGWMYKRLKKHCQAAGLPTVCPHSLRGLHSTLAVAGGSTTHAVAAQLGHASFATTARHYADPTAVQNATIKSFSDALRGAPAALSERLTGLSKEEKARLRAMLDDE